MIKYAVLIIVTMLTGCAAMDSVVDFFASPGGEATVDAVGATFGLPGIIGASLLSLGVGLYKDHRTKKSKIEMIKNLGADAYHDYKSLSEYDKNKLDEGVRDMIPEKYQHYYDGAKLG